MMVLSSALAENFQGGGQQEKPRQKIAPLNFPLFYQYRVYINWGGGAHPLPPTVNTHGYACCALEQGT